MATAKKKQPAKSKQVIVAKKKLNWKVFAVVILAAAIVSYFLFQSHAATYPRAWVPGGQSDVNGSLSYSPTGGSIVHKANGVTYWASSTGGAWAKVSINHLSPNATYCVDFGYTSSTAAMSVAYQITNSRDFAQYPARTLSGNVYTQCVKTASTIASSADTLVLQATDNYGGTVVWRFYQR